MKSYSLIQLVLICFLFAFCKKSDHAGGKVVNLFTGQPVKGITVNVEALNSGFTSPKDGVKQIASATTDSDGSFSLNFKFKENRQSYFRVFIDEMHSKMDTGAVIDEKYILDANICPGCIASDDNTTKPSKDIEFKVAPASRIRLKTDYTSTSFNTLYMTLYSDKFSYDLQFSGYNYYYQINYNYFQVPSNGKVFIKYWTNNYYNVIYDTIAVEPFAKTTYTLHW